MVNCHQHFNSNLIMKIEKDGDGVEIEKVSKRTSRL